MPIYEYQCERCSKTFEILQRAKEKVSCPTCGSRKLKKLLSLFSSPNATAGLKGCASESAACSAERCESGSCPMSQG
jgi:putative FmdB family regulatory protein